MTKFAEIIFETGANSTMSYDSEDEVKNFVAEHHRRAVNGEPGATQNQHERNDLDPGDFAVMPSVDRMKERPAERISAVLLYDAHPIDLTDTRVSAETVKTLVDGMSDNRGTLSHDQLISALRDEASPIYPVSQGRLESIYKATPAGELDLSFLKDVS